MNCIEIATRHIPARLWKTFFVHSVLVTQFSLQIAEKLGLDDKTKKFIEEAAMLHDIGIGKVSMDTRDAQTKPPYILHGLFGEKILADLGYPLHAAVCRNHIGVGLSKEIILKNKFPLPACDMLPSTLPEKIITYADLFFSKTDIYHKRSFAEVKSKISSYGKEQLDELQVLHKRFAL